MDTPEVNGHRGKHSKEVHEVGPLDLMIRRSLFPGRVCVWGVTTCEGLRRG